MKVLLVNGSPNEFGTTRRSLDEVVNVLNSQGIDTEIIYIGKKPIIGCIDCDYCQKNDNKCVANDIVNEFLEKAKTADGFIFASPVHYAGISGAMKCFMDRAFVCGKAAFAYKPCGVLVCARRAGTTAALEQLNKYPLISRMILVASQYWTMAFGAEASDVVFDLEGLQIMRTLGNNLAWVLKVIDKAQLPKPIEEVKQRTNFIR